ncbi:MAG: PEGA domain-containing protein [Deltaproteobacteria bacterium]|nr:PEGA domain-containing protein [Deltaproteobacteria bacterium]
MDPIEYAGPIQSVVEWKLLWLIPALPFFGAAWNALLGHWGQKKYGHAFVHVPAVGAMVASFVIAALSVVELVGLGHGDRFLWNPVWRMIEIGSLSVDLSFAMDPLSAVMALVVTGVGALIHVYSVGYMHTEKAYWRFFCYLNLFCFAMLLLVLGDNFVLMFFGWEGVGLCSYLLIGFWYSDYGKASAGMKAFVVNRIGDFGFVVALGLLFWTLGGIWGQDGYRAHEAPRLVGTTVVAEEAGPAREEHGRHGGHGGRTGLTVAVYPGAKVLVDGKAAGRSPILGRELTSGEHDVELVVGPRTSYEATVTIEEGRETALAVVGPTVSFRQLRDQMVLERRENGESTSLRDAFANKTIWGVGAVTLMCLFFFLGATGKSAQIPLYVWLPDAMAGPTPVSALIHAATMVTAGVYMVARLNFLFSLSPVAMTVVALVGSGTALFAATIGFFQYDIKKVLAYSTVSQLGFMFVGVGVGAYWAGIFHLVTHAFFKACLFLGSGSVIHGMHHVEHGEAAAQDMRRMGGLAKVMPRTARTYFVACMAITAAPVPFLAGFWSKDEILWKAFTTENLLVPGWVVWGLCAVAAGCTAFYMWRSWYLTFHGQPRAEVAEKVKESPASMVRVLEALAVLSIVGGLGLVGVPAWAGGEPILEQFLHPVTALSPQIFELGHRGFAEHHGHLMEIGFMVLSVVIALFGWQLARRRYGTDRQAALAWEPSFPGHRILFNKYFVDEIYAKTVVAAFMQLRLFLGQFDKWVIDGMVNATSWGMRLSAWITGKIDEAIVDGAVNAVSNGTLAVGNRLRRVQTGRIQSYIYGIMTGALVLAVVSYVVL